MVRLKQNLFLIGSVPKRSSIRHFSPYWLTTAASFDAGARRIEMQVGKYRSKQIPHSPSYFRPIGDCLAVNLLALEYQNTHIAHRLLCDMRFHDSILAPVPTKLTGASSGKLSAGNCGSRQYYSSRSNVDGTGGCYVWSKHRLSWSVRLFIVSPSWLK